MGSGTYSTKQYKSMTASRGDSTKSREQIFSQRSIASELDPKQMKNGIRESRDSEEHPLSIPFIFGLDETGSMGVIPENLVRGELPKIMDSIIESCCNDPQIMFIGIGDHLCDQAPLQVSQFESSTIAIDQCLTKIWLEARGGGNHGESYSLAWLIGAEHTSTDHFEKRGKKGFLFTIGDEPVHELIPEQFLVRYMGYERGCGDLLMKDILKRAQEKWHVFHIHVEHGSRRYDDAVRRQLTDLMGENLIFCPENEIVPRIIEAINNTFSFEGGKVVTHTQTVENNAEVKSKVDMTTNEDDLLL